MIAKYLLDRLSILQNEQILCDLELHTENEKVFKVHSCVFAVACTRQFDRLRARKADTLNRLILPGVQSDELEVVLDFIYGRVQEVTHAHKTSKLLAVGLMKMGMFNLWREIKQVGDNSHTISECAGEQTETLSDQDVLSCRNIKSPCDDIENARLQNYVFFEGKEKEGSPNSNQCNDPPESVEDKSLQHLNLQQRQGNAHAPFVVSIKKELLCISDREERTKPDSVLQIPSSWVETPVMQQNDIITKYSENAIKQELSVEDEEDTFACQRNVSIDVTTGTESVVEPSESASLTSYTVMYSDIKMEPVSSDASHCDKFCSIEEKSFKGSVLEHSNNIQLQKSKILPELLNLKTEPSEDPLQEHDTSEVNQPHLTGTNILPDSNKSTVKNLKRLLSEPPLYACLTSPEKKSRTADFIRNGAEKMKKNLKALVARTMLQRQQFVVKKNDDDTCLKDNESSAKDLPVKEKSQCPKKKPGPKPNSPTKTGREMLKNPKPHETVNTNRVLYKSKPLTPILPQTAVSCAPILPQAQTIVQNPVLFHNHLSQTQILPTSNIIGQHPVQYHSASMSGCFVTPSPVLPLVSGVAPSSTAGCATLLPRPAVSSIQKDNSQNGAVVVGTFQTLIPNSIPPSTIKKDVPRHTAFPTVCQFLQGGSTELTNTEQTQEKSIVRSLETATVSRRGRKTGQVFVIQQKGSKNKIKMGQRLRSSQWQKLKNSIDEKKVYKSCVTTAVNKEPEQADELPVSAGTHDQNHFINLPINVTQTNLSFTSTASLTVPSSSQVEAGTGVNNITVPSVPDKTVRQKSKSKSFSGFSNFRPIAPKL